MKSVNSSLSQPMKYSAALFFLLCLMFVTSPSVAYGQSLKDIEKELRDVEEDLQVADYLTDLTERVKSGKVIFIVHEGSPFVMSVQDYATGIALRYLGGKLTREQLKSEIAAISGFRSASLRALSEITAEALANVDRLRDRRSYLINERARLIESSRCKTPNVVGRYTLTGDPSGLLVIDSHSGNQVTGRYGQDESSLVNTIQGKFLTGDQCNVLSGTFRNTQYNTTGNFTYTFSSNGASFSGRWNQDNGYSGSWNGTKR